jgi:hypothetical protein
MASATVLVVMPKNPASLSTLPTRATASSRRRSISATAASR